MTEVTANFLGWDKQVPKIEVPDHEVDKLIELLNLMYDAGATNTCFDIKSEEV